MTEVSAARGEQANAEQDYSFINTSTQHHRRELLLTSSTIIGSAFIPFLIQEHEACYKHSLSLKASSNLILIFTG